MRHFLEIINTRSIYKMISMIQQQENNFLQEKEDMKLNKRS